MLYCRSSRYLEIIQTIVTTAAGRDETKATCKETADFWVDRFYEHEKEFAYYTCTKQFLKENLCKEDTIEGFGKKRLKKDVRAYLHEHYRIEASFTLVSRLSDIEVSIKKNFEEEVMKAKSKAQESAKKEGCRLRVSFESELKVEKM